MSSKFNSKDIKGNTILYRQIYIWNKIFNKKLNLIANKFIEYLYFCNYKIYLF